MASVLVTGRVDFQPHHHCIGPAPDEVILHYVVASGTFQGPHMHLTAIANCGAEWGTVRGDGVIAFESRQILRTPRDDLVCASLFGLYDVGDDGYIDALDGALSSKVHAEFVVRFQVAAREYRWLNRGLFIGDGERDFGAHSLELRIFSLED